MNINISYYLDEYGGSICWIYTRNKFEKCYEIFISHAGHREPIWDCLDGLIDIINGETKVKFNWRGASGGNQIIIQEIPTEKHSVIFRVIDFLEDSDEEVENLDLEANNSEIEFEIKKVQLVRMFYYEFKKNSELMKDEDFLVNREGDFPVKRFQEFEKLALKYIN